jgi:hypothetical protein
MSADGTRTIWTKDGLHPGAVIKASWGNELFAHHALKSYTSLLLCYLVEDVAKRAKLTYCDRRDLAGVVKDTGHKYARTPEVVEYAEGEEAPFRLTLTLENQLEAGPGKKALQSLTWDVVLKVLSRKWENGEAQMCAVINLAYREEQDSSAGLEFRKFKAVFDKVTEKDVFKHFKKFHRQRTIAGSGGTRALDPKDLLPRMCAKLQVAIDCERKAFEVLDVMTRSGDFGGKKQSVLAAVAILYTATYLTTSRIPSAAELAKQAGVQENVVKTQYEKMQAGRSGSRLNDAFGEEIKRLKALRR